MSLVVLDFDVEKHPEATPPDFSKQYKKEETIKAKEQAWKGEGLWKSDPVNCLITLIRVANPDDPEKDIELPATEKSLIQLVNDFASPDVAVVADDVTHKTCILANTIIAMITELSKEPKEDDEFVIDELHDALGRLYAFKLAYIQANFVHGNCHNLAKTLKWDALDGTVPQKMLGLSEKATRLATLRALALRCGLG